MPRRLPGPALAVLAAVVLAACGSGGSSPAGAGRAGTGGSGSRATPATGLAARAAPWSLPAPVSRPAAAVRQGHVVVLGGLATGDTSTATVEEIDPASGAVVSRGSLATAVHDTAGAVIGGSAYVFGGGAASSLDSVQAWDSGAARVVGHLPTPRSDLAAATIGSTTYLVGGFTGSALPGAILATTDGTTFKVVGALIQPVRYPAVAADPQGRLWIFGGELGTTESALSGGQTDDIQRFDPSTGQTALVGHLPETLGHAAAALLGGSVFVIGGRHSGTATAQILRIDTTTATATPAGSLPGPVSDAGLAVVGGTGYLLGGEVSGPTAPRSSVVTLTPTGATGGSASASTPASPASPSRNIYAADGPNMLAPALRNVPYRIYVPESAGQSVDVIDPATYRVIDRYTTGLDPQHVIPAWDLKTLYAANDLGNSLTPIDPYTGKPSGANIPVADPYNMYFTPDGRSAIIVEEARQILAFRDPHTFALQKEVPVQCPGVDHGDFSADGTFALFSCEFSAKVVKIDLASRSVAGYLTISGSSPQDVKLDSAGRVFYVADMNHGGVWMIDAATFSEIGFIPTGRDAHGLYVSRDGRSMYVTNRGAGTVSVIDLASRQVSATWTIPGGGSPDMGNISPDGKVLWVSGRYDACVYAISTVDGHLIAKVPVPNKPHGLAVWPQPGRYSLGHTGIMR